jgi:hypothetical protein
MVNGHVEMAHFVRMFLFPDLGTKRYAEGAIYFDFPVLH